MNKIRSVAIVWLCVCLLFVGKNLFAQAVRPNIVLIIADDLGWKDISCNGSRYYETPNIDQLAKEGMFFTNAYANAPNCTPSRAALMSGQYAPRTGVYTVGNSERGEKTWRAVIPTPNTSELHQDKITIAETLRNGGYKTGFVGKWHLGASPLRGPLEQGFDVNIGGCNNGKLASYFSPYHHELIEDGPPGEYMTNRLTDEAIKFISNNHQQPFFLTLAYHAPHTPVQAPDSLIWKYIPKPAHNGHFDPIYAAMIESMDNNIGRLLQYMEKIKIDSNTIVIFFSDNGGLHAVTSMHPLRGYKGSLYEGGIRVPLIIKWPGHIKPGTNCKEPVLGIDFYPTFSAIAGVPLPSDYPLDGESLLPLLYQKGNLKRNALYWHYPVYLQAGYGLKQLWRTAPVSVIRKGNYKLMEYFEDGHVELYNLAEDISEKNNLATRQPEKAKELLLLLRNWRQEIKALPVEKNPLYDPGTIPKKIAPQNRARIYLGKE